jgi:alpha-glucosidase
LYEIPTTNPFPVDPFANSTYSINLSAITFEFTKEPFDFRIVRKANNATLFSTYEQNIIFSLFYIEIGTEVDSDYIYGLGERFENNFRKTTGKWSIWNKDRPEQIDYGMGR